MDTSNSLSNKAFKTKRIRGTASLSGKVPVLFGSALIGQTDLYGQFVLVPKFTTKPHGVGASRFVLTVLHQVRHLLSRSTFLFSAASSDVAAEILIFYERDANTLPQGPQYVQTFVEKSIKDGSSEWGFLKSL